MGGISPNFDRTFCEQIVKTLVRRWRLICVCTVCICPINRTLSLLRSAVAGRIYKLCAKHKSNSGFDRTFMPCSGLFYALPNNEQGIKYRRLTYSAKQTVREICRATYSASQTRLRIYLTASITVVQSIETPQTT